VKKNVKMQEAKCTRIFPDFFVSRIRYFLNWKRHLVNKTVMKWNKSWTLPMTTLIILSNAKSSWNWSSANAESPLSLKSSRVSLGMNAKLRPILVTTGKTSCRIHRAQLFRTPWGPKFPCNSLAKGLSTSPSKNTLYNVPAEEKWFC